MVPGVFSVEEYKKNRTTYMVCSAIEVSRWPVYRDRWGWGLANMHFDTRTNIPLALYRCRGYRHAVDCFRSLGCCPLWETLDLLDFVQRCSRFPSSKNPGDHVPRALSNGTLLAVDKPEHIPRALPETAACHRIGSDYSPSTNAKIPGVAQRSHRADPRQKPSPRGPEFEPPS